MAIPSPDFPIVKKSSPAGLALAIYLLAHLLLLLYVGDHAWAQENDTSDYSLIGTIQSRNFKGAVVAVSKNEQFFYRLGEKLPDGSQVVSVHPDSIVLRESGGNEYDLYITHAANPAAKTSHYSPPRQSVQTQNNLRKNNYERKHRTRFRSRNAED